MLSDVVFDAENDGVLRIGISRVWTALEGAECRVEAYVGGPLVGARYFLKIE